MGDAQDLARAVFAGCSANVGPLIGIELGVRDPQVETAEAPLEGVYAVLPLDVELDSGAPARVELASPLEDLARLARRMLGNDDPDTKRELSDDDRDAIAEILAVMGSCVDQALREQLRTGRASALAWWRSDAPGAASFAAGAHGVARGGLTVPGSQDVECLLRLPADLLQRGGAAPSEQAPGCVLLLELEAETGGALARSLSAARVDVRQAQLSEPELVGRWPEVRAAIVSAAVERGFEIARELRIRDETWQLPVLMCASAPTRALVIRALECGASHVLAVPRPMQRPCACWRSRATAGAERCSGAERRLLCPQHARSTVDLPDLLGSLDG